VCLMAGFSLDRCLLNVPTPHFDALNQRWHSDATWEKLESEDAELAEVAREMTLRYGYNLNRTEEDVIQDRAQVEARQEELMALFVERNPTWRPEMETERLRIKKEVKAKNRARKEAARAHLMLGVKEAEAAAGDDDYPEEVGADEEEEEEKIAEF